MTDVDLSFHGYKYFPYERRFAELEVSRLLGAMPHEVNGSLHVRTVNGVDRDLVHRLTYFHQAVIGAETTVIPQQARLEASSTVHDDPSRLRRQRTRYSAHGLHEYRGKFNPQMVRASFNLLGLQTGGRVWDPFCGSGTVLLEALHQGFSAIGVDLNPLAVSIANAKLAALRARPQLLQDAVDRIAAELDAYPELIGEDTLPDDKTIVRNLGDEWMSAFTCGEYLASWFPRAVLAQLRLILDSIDRVVPPSVRGIFRIVLSDIVRDVSWQDPGDLRIRRRKDPALNYPAGRLFLSNLRDRVNTIVAAREHLVGPRFWQRAFEGSSCDSNSLQAKARSFLSDGVDCVLSSPPYATALPYIDTQRLSLALLGLATPEVIRQLDSALVGSREISTSSRRAIELAIDCNEARLSRSTWDLCKRLKMAYDPESDGFRRQNTPAVVYRYFDGMTRAMAQATHFLRPGGWLAFIVGPNATTLGGQDFLIDTPALLASTGEHVGLELVEMHELDTYSRFDVHSRNSIREERLLIMRKP